MNYAQPVLILATLMVCLPPSVLGIVCNKCTPAQASLITCNTAKQLSEVNCDNLNDTIPGTNVTIKYDTCISAKIVATLSGIQIPTYVMECAVKDSSSEPSMINCTSAEASICTQAREDVMNQTYIQITSCNAKCCNSTRCNNLALIKPAGSTTPAGNTTTAGKTTPAGNTTAAGGTTVAGTTTAATATTKSGAIQVQPPVLGFLLIILTMVSTITLELRSAD